MYVQTEQGIWKVGRNGLATQLYGCSTTGRIAVGPDGVVNVWSYGGRSFTFSILQGGVLSGDRTVTNPSTRVESVVAGRAGALYVQLNAGGGTSYKGWSHLAPGATQLVSIDTRLAERVATVGDDGYFYQAETVNICFGMSEQNGTCVPDRTVSRVLRYDGPNPSEIPVTGFTKPPRPRRGHLRRRRRADVRANRGQLGAGQLRTRRRRADAGARHRRCRFRHRLTPVRRRGRPRPPGGGRPPYDSLLAAPGPEPPRGRRGEGGKMAPMPSVLSQLTDRFAAVIGTDPELRPAGRPEFGHFQCNVAMRLGKAEGVPPRQVAQRIVDQVDVSDLCEPLEIAGPGFINIRVRSSALATAVDEQLADPSLGVPHHEQPQRVVIDYSAPNVAKPMHVGNLRSTIIGDCLARVLRSVGDTVIAQNHIGDWGTQFGMLVEQILTEGTDVSTLDLNGSVALYRRAQVHFRGDEEFADAARRRVVALQSGDAETLSIWRALIEVSKEGFNKAYARLGVLLTDDDLAGESMYNAMLAGVAAELQEQGIAVVDDGALVVFVEGDDAPLIVRKSDGGYGYAATDLAAIRYRFGKLDADRCIYVVGLPQSHHFQQVFAVARMAGWVPPAGRTEHVGFGSVLGPDGKMFKTRDGATVTLDTLLDAAEDAAAPDVAMAAVKYADLSSSLHKDYVFDVDRMTATTGNTGPYLQYAHARVSKILRDAAARGIETENLSVRTLGESAEELLALHLTKYGEVVATLAEDLQPHRLCTYLFDLASLVSTFYEQCPVLKAEGEVRESRLALCTAVKRVLGAGLGLLGIVAPEVM